MIRTCPSPEASISTFERIGIVLRRSTTDWTWDRQRSSFARSMVAFIATKTPLSPSGRNRPQAPELVAISLAGPRHAARKKRCAPGFAGENRRQSRPQGESRDLVPSQWSLPSEIPAFAGMMLREHRHAAVHVQRLAGDVACLLRGEECDGGAHVL